MAPLLYKLIATTLLAIFFLVSVPGGPVYGGGGKPVRLSHYSAAEVRRIGGFCPLLEFGSVARIVASFNRPASDYADGNEYSSGNAIQIRVASE